MSEMYYIQSLNLFHHVLYSEILTGTEFVKNYSLVFIDQTTFLS